MLFELLAPPRDDLDCQVGRTGLHKSSLYTTRTGIEFSCQLLLCTATMYFLSLSVCPDNPQRWRRRRTPHTEIKGGQDFDHFYRLNKIISIVSIPSIRLGSAAREKGELGAALWYNYVKRVGETNQLSHRLVSHRLVSCLVNTSYVWLYACLYNSHDIDFALPSLDTKPSTTSLVFDAIQTCSIHCFETSPMKSRESCLCRTWPLSARLLYIARPRVWHHFEPPMVLGACCTSLRWHPASIVAFACIIHHIRQPPAPYTSKHWIADDTCVEFETRHLHILPRHFSCAKKCRILHPTAARRQYAADCHFGRSSSWRVAQFRLRYRFTNIETAAGFTAALYVSVPSNWSRVPLDMLAGHSTSTR